MPALVSVAWGAVLGFACGGSLGRLKLVELRYPYLLLAAFLIQGISRGRLVVPGAASWSVVIWGAVSLVLVAALLLQPDSPMLNLVAVGVALNLLVVLLNGFMPIYAGPGVDPAAVTQAMSDSGGFYAMGTSATIARVLADGLALPVLGHAYLLSVGDVLLLCGATGFIATSMLRENADAHTEVS